MVEVLLVLEIFLTKKAWVEDLLCGSSAMIFSACSFNLFSMIFSMALLGWLMRLIVQFGSYGIAAGCLCWEEW